MAITSGVCDSYLQELFSGVHTSADTYKIALYTDTAVLNSTTSVYTTNSEVVGTGYTSGGLILSGFTTSVDAGISILDFSVDPVWTSTAFTAKGAMIYNSSKSDKAVAVIDFGSNLTTTGGDFVITFPAPTATTGLIKIS